MFRKLVLLAIATSMLLTACGENKKTRQVTIVIVQSSYTPVPTPTVVPGNIRITSHTGVNHDEEPFDDHYRAWGWAQFEGLEKEIEVGLTDGEHLWCWQTISFENPSFSCDTGFDRVYKYNVDLVIKGCNDEVNYVEVVTDRTSNALMPGPEVGVSQYDTVTEISCQ